MSMGQTFLALGAIMLLMVITTTLNRTYVVALSETLDHQLEMEAIQFGQAISESIFSASREYENLTQMFGHLTNVSNKQQRIEFLTAFNDTLYATIHLSSEQQLLHAVEGRTAHIRVYTKDNSNYRVRAENIVTINPR